jgi:hypothetical protein
VRGLKHQLDDRKHSVDVVTLKPLFEQKRQSTGTSACAKNCPDRGRLSGQADNTKEKIVSGWKFCPRS